MQDLILSCDWGTSTFRLTLVDISNGKILGKIASNKGIADTYNKWNGSFGESKISKKDYFLRQLREDIDLLSRKYSISLKEIPVIVSGMACSSIGIEELPYASLPFSIDGSDAIVKVLTDVNEVANKVWLISGISNGKDVMRGEETQMIGLAKFHAKLFTESATIWIFPGTHSKHLKVQKGKVIDFRTYMTGELFNLMRHHSILKDSISAYENDHVLAESDIEAFRLGVHQSAASGLLTNLFSVRINQLFKYLKKEENFFYLSGLLIGDELRSLGGQEPGIVLCCGNKMNPFYQLAIESLGLLDRTIIIPPDSVDNAVIDGQIEIFERQLVRLK